MTAQTFDIPYGEHIFILARPISGDWTDIHSRGRSREADWRPCMVNGHDDGQRIWIIGSAYAHPLDQFEIGPILTVCPDAEISSVTSEDAAAPAP